jgi:hypothetical protein
MKKMPLTMEDFNMANEYNGWKNRETWNVALWLGNDYPLYCVAQGYKGYKTPYLSLRAELHFSFGYTKTMDGVSLWDESLDIAALNDLITEA